MTYVVWDVVSGNALAEFGDRQAALDAIGEWLRMSPGLKREDFVVSTDEGQP